MLGRYLILLWPYNWQRALPTESAARLRLFDLEVREELDEPLEALLVPVDPEEVDLPEAGMMLPD